MTNCIVKNLKRIKTRQVFFSYKNLYFINFSTNLFMFYNFILIIFYIVHNFSILQIFLFHIIVLKCNIFFLFVVFSFSCLHAKCSTYFYQFSYSIKKNSKNSNKIRKNKMKQKRYFKLNYFLVSRHLYYNFKPRKYYLR